MNIHGVTSSWLRSFRKLMYVFVVLCALASLSYTYLAAYQGDIPGAVIGAGATLAIVGVTGLWAASLRLGMALLRNRRRLERLERRLRTVDRGVASQGEQMKAQAEQLSETCRQIQSDVRSLAGSLESRNAELDNRLDNLRTRVEAFSRLHDEQSDRLEKRMSALEVGFTRSGALGDRVSIEDSGWSDDETPPGERTVSAYHQLVAEHSAGDTIADANVMADKRALRQEFAGLIHRRDFIGALAKGDELVRKFPNSTAAGDFKRVRPHLVRRIELERRKAAGT